MLIMTNEEIVASYREAKDKRTQVRILAELNACGRDEIRAVLEAAGLEVPPRAYNRRTERQIEADASRSEKMRDRAKRSREEKENVVEKSLAKKAAEVLQEPEAVATSQQANGLPNEVLEALTEKVIEITEQIDALTKKAEAIRDFITGRMQ